MRQYVFCAVAFTNHRWNNLRPRLLINHVPRHLIKFFSSPMQPHTHTPSLHSHLLICRLKTSSLWEEPCFWEKAFHIHLPFLLKMVQQRCYKKLHEHGTTPDSRHARKNASMIRLVIWQQAVDRPEALAHHSSEP